MQSENLNNYITKRYNRWLDYAMYHCRRSGLNLEPAEVLNDVLCQLLQRNPVKLERLLNERRDKYSRLDYLVLRVIRRWNNGELPVALIHPASAGHGLNLQAGGNVIVWFGLNWSLELYQQANARLHRQGQTKPVIIHHLVAPGTMDEDVMASLSRKGESQDALMEAVKARIKKYKK